MRKSQMPISVGQAGRAIARAIRRPLFDVTRMITATRGFLGKDVPEECLEGLTDALKEMNVDFFVVPMAVLSSLPALGRFGSGSFSAEGFRCEVNYWDGWQSIDRSWQDVVLISCGRLSAQPGSTGEAETRYHYQERTAGPERYQFLIDIILEEPAARIRIEQHAGEGAAGIRQTPVTEAQLMHVARQIVQYSADVPKNEGVRTLAFDGPTGFWLPVTFQTRHDFDDYNIWLLELLKYGLPLPGESAKGDEENSSSGAR